MHCASVLCIDQTSPKAEITAQPQREIFLFLMPAMYLLRREHSLLNLVRGYNAPPFTLYMQTSLVNFMYKASISFSLKIVMCEEQPGHMTWEYTWSFT